MKRKDIEETINLLKGRCKVVGGKCFTHGKTGCKTACLKFKKLSLKGKCITALLVIAMCTGVSYAATADSRAERRAEEARLAEIVAYNRDKADADAKKAELNEKIKKAELVISEIAKKGEFIAASTEFTSKVELTKNHDGSWIGKKWSGNVLKLEIEYLADYKIALDRVSMQQVNGVIYIDIDNRDFELVVNQEEILSRDASKEDKGWFPAKFDDKETIALITADKERIEKELKTKTEFLSEAESSLKEFLSELGQSWGVEIKFVEKGGNNNVKKESTNEVNGK